MASRHVTQNALENYLFGRLAGASVAAFEAQVLLWARLARTGRKRPRSSFTEKAPQGSRCEVTDHSGGPKKGLTPANGPAPAEEQEIRSDPVFSASDEAQGD